MIKGYIPGMLSLHHVCSVTLLYEPGNAGAVFAEFKEEANKSNGKEAEQIWANLRFLVSVARICRIKDKDAHDAVRHFLQLLINKNFDFEYSYNWQELKSILFYCTYMRGIKSFKEFDARMLSPAFNTAIANYMMQDSCMPQRKESFIKETEVIKAAANTQLSLKIA